MNMRRNWFFIGPAAIIGLALFTFLGGELVRQLWNWLTPSLFGWKQITFWQAIGLLGLCRILFGGFRLGGPNRAYARRRIAERMEHMTPEERERYRAAFRARCGFGPANSENPSEGGTQGD